MPLEAHVPDVEAAAPFDVRALDEVVLINVIACRPDNARGSGFGLGFGAELHSPLAPLVVLNANLFRRAGTNALLDGKLALRFGCAVCAARAVEHDTTLDVLRFAP